METEDDKSTATAAFPYTDIVQSLTVRHIQTPADKLVGFSPNESASEASATLRTLGFDYGPVRGQDGRLQGRVARSKLAKANGGVVGDSFELLSPTFLISADSQVRQVLEWLSTDPWLLVVDGRQIAGLVTPSDLNRQAARLYFYLLVADFEIRPAEAVREYFPNQETALALLNGHTRRGVEHRVTRSRQGDIDSDIVAAMFLTELLTIAEKSEGVRRCLAHVETDDWAWARKSLAEFRNSVMHPVKPILTDTSGLSDLIEIEDRLRRLSGDEEL